MKAVVLGGGIAGLTVGIGLQRSGVATTIVEAAPGPGGQASGFRAAGYTFDLFSHRLWTRDAAVLALVQRWSASELQTRRKVSRILLDGRLYNYPIDIRDVLAGGSPRFALRALAGYASAKLNRAPEGDNFRSCMVARYGEPLFDSFFGPYTEKLCGLSPAQISIDLAAGAVPSTGIWKQLMQRLLQRADPWDDFLYPAGGFMDLPGGMATAFTREGGRLLLRHRVKQMTTEGDRIVNVEAGGDAGSLSLPADLVISTVPLPALLRTLSPAAEQDVIAHADSLRTRAMVCVYLGIARERLSDDHWIYIPDADVRFNRLSETTNYSPAMAPAGHTGICAEIACEAGDPVWNEPPAAQAQRVIDDLIRIGHLPDATDVRHTWVRRFRHAYPVYQVGYRQHLDAVEGHLAGFSNLKLCGRQGAFWYGSTAQGIRQGLDLIRDLGGVRSLAA